jgi:hypothetical protein
MKLFNVVKRYLAESVFAVPVSVSSRVAYEVGKVYGAASEKFVVLSCTEMV